MTKQETHKKSEIENKDKLIKELNHKTKELSNSLQHLQAEFENYKKRIDKEN